MSLSKQTPCAQCGLKDLCMTRDMSAQDAEKFARSVRQTRSMDHASALFWQGDRVTGLYAVRSGAVKTVARDSEGQERVRGFFLPGDVIGLDALHSGTYPANAETMGEASFCVLPYSAIGGLLAEMPSFAQRIMGLLSRELAQSLSLSGEYTADQRIAAFLMDLADRMTRHADSDQQFTLEMSRADIANYLRLVPETVSRVLSRFSKKGLISVQRRNVRILDRKALGALASPLREAMAPVESLRQAA